MLHVIVGILLIIVGLIVGVVGWAGALADPTGAPHYAYLAPGAVIALLGLALAIWG